MKEPKKLTSFNKTSIKEPLNKHRWIADRFNSCLEMNFTTLDLGYVTQWDDKLWWRIDFVTLSWCFMWFSTFNMTQVDDFWFRFGSEVKN